MMTKVASGFACINEDSDDETPRDEAPTFATQLNQLIAWYDKGMAYLADGEVRRAVMLFDRVLLHPTSVDVRASSPPEGDPLHAAVSVCQACLKMKGEILTRDHPLEAFEHLKEASLLDRTDVVLAKKLGTLALEIGYVAFARHVLETALLTRSDYVPLKESLMEVYLEIQSYDKATDLARSVLEDMPGNRRAKEILRLNAMGDVLLEPDIVRRIDWEPKPHNSIQRFVSPVSWTGLERALCEILNGSYRVDTKRRNRRSVGGICIRSLTTEWDTLSTAIVVCEVLRPKIQADVDLTEEKVDNDVIMIDAAPAAPVRFPLRSRLAATRAEEEKQWNVIEMIKDAFSEEDWNALLNIQRTSTPVPESTDREGSGGGRDAVGAVEVFLRGIGADEGCDPHKLATAVLEHRIRCLDDLEDEEATQLCSLDGLIVFDSTPSYSLVMGELLFDAFIASKRSIDADTVEGNNKLLIGCRKHLMKCIGHKTLIELNETTTGDDAFFENASMTRLYWALGKLQLMEGHYVEAESILRNASMHLAKCEAEVKLHHVRYESTITIEAVRSKLVACLYHDIVDHLPDDEEALDREVYSDMCTLLRPALFPGENRKQPDLSSDHRSRALRFLQKASNEAGEIDTEFRCRLYLLDTMLKNARRLEAVDVDDFSSPSSELPLAMSSSVEAIPPRTLFIQIQSLAAFFQSSFNRSPTTVEMTSLFPSLHRSEILTLLRRILTKTLSHLEWCFWRFNVKGHRKNASAIDSRKRALHEAAALVFVLVQLDPEFGIKTEIMERLALILWDLLTERDAVITKRPSHLMLHLLIDRFSAWVDFLSRMDDEEQEDMTEFNRKAWCCNIEDKEDVPSCTEALIGGVSHFVEHLYGLDLVGGNDTEWKKRRNRGSVSMHHPGRHDLRLVWRYLSPCLSYFESREGDLKVFGKLKSLLKILIDLLDRPSSEMLSMLSMESIFDDEASVIDRALEQGKLPVVLTDALKEREKRVRSVEHLDIHENLYYYYCLAQLDDDIDLAGPDGILSEKGMTILEDQIKWIKLDLAFNPDRYWTWECLGINFKDATESFLSACVRDLLPGEFFSTYRLMIKWKTLLRWQCRCFSIAYLLAKEQGHEENQSYVLEMLMELDAMMMTYQPPFLFQDARSLKSTPDRLRYAQLLQSKLIQSTTINPSPKWQIHYYMGKLCTRVGGEEWQRRALMHFSDAVRAAERDEGGLIDPLYRLHAVRLKLLNGGYTDWESLKVNAFKQESVVDDDIAASIAQDCRSALEFCRSKMIGYHRVPFQLARSAFEKGSYSEALTIMQQLFVKGRKKFCIAFGPIESRPVRSVQKTASIVKISGSGRSESVWKFVHGVRKYLILYLKLLYFTNDVEGIGFICDALNKGDFDAPACLSTILPNRYRYPCLADMCRTAVGMKLLCINDGIRRTLAVETVMEIEEILVSIVGLLFRTQMQDASYAEVTRELDRLVQRLFSIRNGMTTIDAAPFATSMEVLCQSQCNLQTDGNLHAVARVLLEIPREPPGTPHDILAWIQLCASVYPVYILWKQDVALTSKLATMATHRALKADRPICKSILQRVLFVVVQMLFYRAEDIRIKASPVATSVEETDTAIFQIMTQIGQLIRSFSDVLHDSRFLCLRVMHIMSDAHEATGILHREQNIKSVVQPHVSLKTQFQTIMTGIQDIRTRDKPTASVIDLTTEEDQRIPPSIRTVLSRPPAVVLSRPPSVIIPPPLVLPGAVHQIRDQGRTIQTPLISPQLTTRHDKMEEHRTEIVEPRPSQRGAFVDAFQQFMVCDDDDQND